MKKIIYFPGSFDPFTNGHLSLVNKVLPLCDKLIIGIGDNAKKSGFLPPQKRKNAIDKIFEKKDNIETQIFNGLAVNAAKNAGANFIARGIRNTTDLEYEMQMAEMNEIMMKEIATIFIPTTDQDRAISSTLVRQIFSMQGDVSPFVPSAVLDIMKT